eukprot:CAMPEP_0198240892 /NCGR_PEP_ID=MMETSP1446-20131203/5879_1 /TAXON_ID=1461542 ORGANISM="Unidentified sp, Strain CCMP2111" /NCGR_SAMPLE_ID=MMETSP1446 /ASSEMBLY_ACC=CAM_ASM_001112 /LENGTH=375 /DNA_ID=CAMNT_0043923675 /DNA_START=376 /DNA_END=1503 /DNA_ORIENTATION=+
MKRELCTTMDSNSDVKVSDLNRFKVASLNRPRALNAISKPIVEELHTLFSTWDQSPQVHGIVLKGEGEKAFCAGGDVKSVTESYKQGHKDSTLDFFRREYKLNFLISKLNAPYIALIDGITMGGGAGLSMHGRFRVATERTLFAMPECALGLFTDVGASYFLTHLLPENLGTCLALTGTRVRGGEMKAIGLATHYVPSWRLPYLEERIQDLGESGRDQKSVDLAIKEFEEDMPMESSILMSKMDRINACFGHNSVEKIAEELGSFADNGDKWCAEQKKAMAKGSPTSLKVNLELLRRGKSLTLNECLKMEYRLLTRFMEGSDFYEGVRAILVDKDFKPTWNPATLDQVTSDTVSEHFAQLPSGEELDLPLKPAKL